MSDRIPPPYRPQQSPVSGLIGWLEQTRVRLPLTRVECRFSIFGELADVQIDQVFHQQLKEPIDCTYTFPLPAGAAVYGCEMHINGRIIRARVEEAAHARDLAQRQKAAGYRTALVETERENLFTLALGNVQPGDLVIIRLRYFEIVTRLADWTSLRIPFCPGVRYIPGKPLLRGLRGTGVADDTDQVPDASRLSPPRIDALHPDAACLWVEGVVADPVGRIEDLSSPSHPVVVRDGEGQCAVSLAEGSAVPDCDFALRWTEGAADRLTSVGWVLREGEESHALVRLQGPQTPASEAAAPKDFYFLVDRSGSMQGLKWQKAVQAFRAFVRQLGPEDRVWATFFNTTWQDLAEHPMTALDLWDDAGLKNLEQVGANGGTEMLSSLNHVLQAVKWHSREREPVMILISDGQVGNEAAIVNALKAHPDLVVHTFGIDTAVNDALLRSLAAQQRGSCCLLQPTDDIVGAVTRLGPRLRNPVMTALAAEEGWESPGSRLPDLHAGESLSLVLRLGDSGATEAVLRGRLADGRPEILRVPLISRDEPAIRLWWVKNRMAHCLEAGRREEALSLARRHNLLCQGAAFIAWDETEQVIVAERDLCQPALFSIRAPHVRAELESIHVSYAYERRDPRDAQRAYLASAADRFASDPVTRALGRQLAQSWGSFLTPDAPERQLLVDLIELLLAWVAAGDPNKSKRVNAVKALLDRLQREATDLAAATAIVRKWLKQAMGDDDAFRERLTAMADNLETPNRRPV